MIRMRRHRAYWLRDPLTHERFPLGALAHLISPGDVVWDVGANIGMYVRFEADVFGAGRVIAFEPMSENRQILAENVKLSRSPAKVTIVPFALSDSDGAAELQIDDAQSGTAALSSVTQGEASAGRVALGLPPKTEQIETRTVDSMIRESQLPIPNVMKIDVEGAETKVLQGAASLLETHHVKLLIELHGVERGQEVGHLLLDKGYRLWGKVSPRLNASCYASVDRALLNKLELRYDLHFLIASKQAADLPSQIVPFNSEK